uniref:hypothetical protein n=1 Tax=uncultured Rhizobium sp. TaxID=155567 RepID=UPI0026341374|nr:hypothetical protein [uncultured Rhizobium sp.]
MIFSWFKKKSEPTCIVDAIHDGMEDLRKEMGDEVYFGAMAYNVRVNELRSLKIQNFNELLGVSDDLGEKMMEAFSNCDPKPILDIYAFCVSVVAAAINFTNIPADEQPKVRDIYFDLWVDAIGQHAQNFDKEKLKASITRVSGEYEPDIVRTFTASSAVQAGFANPPVTLMKTIDQMAGVSRSETSYETIGPGLQALVDHTVRRVQGIVWQH